MRRFDMPYKVSINGEIIDFQFVNQIPIRVVKILLEKRLTYEDLKGAFDDHDRGNTNTFFLKIDEFHALSQNYQRLYPTEFQDGQGTLFRFNKEWGIGNSNWNRFIEALPNLGIEWALLTVQQDDQPIEAHPKYRDTQSSIEMNSHPNTILFGPPGTGKTHHTIQMALDILDPDRSYIGENVPKNIKSLKEIFPEQLAFVTFHQSMSYEDFVEGLKAESQQGQVHYRVQDGIFKRMAMLAHYDFICWSDPQPITFEELYSQLLQIIALQLPYELNTKAGKPVYIQAISQNKNLHTFHEGSELKHTVSKHRLEKLYQSWSSSNQLSGIININDDFRKVIGGSNATVYWAVLNKLIALKEEMLENYDDFNLYQEEYCIDYQDKKNRIISQSIGKKYTNPPRNYVLIIDEINRGNMSRIFGELITLIEPSKRLGAEEEITLTLPYSGDDFGVPKNLYIIGTMNTADRSLALMDTALRRRFDFIEMMPQSELLSENVEGVNLRLLLSAMNERIEALYDREHTLGHAFLMNIDHFDQLKSAFKNKILPLLEEYFFEDWEKIQLVLGNAPFYQKKETKLGDKFYTRYMRDDSALDDTKNYRNIYA